MCEPYNEPETAAAAGDNRGWQTRSTWDADLFQSMIAIVGPNLHHAGLDNEIFE
jgi:hypothetical protein